MSCDKLGKPFCARFYGECSACEEEIVPGEDIRADGDGGYIHADTSCERIYHAERLVDKVLDGINGDRVDRSKLCPEHFQVPSANGNYGCCE